MTACRLHFSIGGEGRDAAVATLRFVIGVGDARRLVLLCDKACEILAETSSRFTQFREVLVAMEGKVDGYGLTAAITLLRASRVRGDRIL